MGGEVATALAEANPARVERMVLIDSPPKPETTFKLGTRLALMPVLGELMSRFMTDATIRKMLAQGFAPGFEVPDKFVADVKQLTYTAFRTARDDSMAYEKAKTGVRAACGAQSTASASRHLRLARCARVTLECQAFRKRAGGEGGNY
jgi:pimeloyl-ACP methyl ester carboxylesterase